MRSKTLGYTLVELMIVTAILATIATIAMAAYVNYVRTSQISVIDAHFEVAERFARYRYAQAASEVATGVAPDPPVPNDASGWIAIITDDAKMAPLGGPTYLPGSGDPVTGAIGIEATGSYLSGDSAIDITRPAFKGAVERTVRISMGS